MLPQLESDAGEAISYDLVVRLRGPSIEGDDNAAGTEARLSFFTDTVYIDQSRKGVDAGGRMTRKRTIHDLRDVAKNLLAEYWAAKFDEEFFMYLSGARGVNDGFNEPLGYTGRANNSFTAPDANHIIYGGAATSKATVASTDKASVTLLDKFVSRARMLNVNSSSIPAMKPIMVDGEERYVALFNPWQMYDIRTEAGAGKWLDIQKAAAAAEGQNNPIFKGNHGMYRGVVLHEHENVIQFSDYGAGSNVSAVRGLALGNQAGVCAFGSPGTGLRFDWTEEKLRTLNQEQLLNLLANFDHQRAIGRLPEALAAKLEPRITSLLTGQNCTKRRKQVAKLAIIEGAFRASNRDAP
jgi:N4-gp56 family major capsid protein